MKNTVSCVRFEKQAAYCRILGSHSSGYEEYHLPEYNAEYRFARSFYPVYIHTTSSTLDLLFDPDDGGNAETSVTYQTTQCRIPEESILQILIFFNSVFNIFHGESDLNIIVTMKCISLVYCCTVLCLCLYVCIHVYIMATLRILFCTSF
jgi:hypothetical protein